MYLHRPSNKHLAQGYAAFIRFGPKHVYLRALCEVEVDPAGSAKRGKKTNQLIYEYDSVRISAFHLQIATKSELKQGEYLREWAGTLEVPLSASLEAFEALGLSLGLNTGDSQPSISSQPGGATPQGYQGGDAPPTSGSGSTSLTPEVSAPDPDKISEWMGEPGSLGKYARDAQDPESRFFVSISKALAGCLRHGHLPHQHHLSAPCLCHVPVQNATTVGDNCGRRQTEAGPPLEFGNRPCNPPNSSDLASRVA